MSTRRRLVMLTRSLSILATAAMAIAASPPDLVNYQGVLRDASDKPRNGSFDMVFSFFDAATAGSQILVDSHTGGGGNAVSVSSGLFSAQLGGGTITDGSGAGTYTALSQVFRDFTAVWLEVKVGSETLSPRVRVQSAAYALNSSNLGGKPAGSFVDTSSTAQTKTGTLNLDTTTSGGFGLNVTGQSQGAYVSGANSYAYLANNDQGVKASGSSYGGVFQNTNGNYVYLGTSGSGVEGHSVGPFTPGGYFQNDTSGVNASLGGPTIAVYGSGSTSGSGGYFVNPAGASVSIAGDKGVDAYSPNIGGKFENPGNSAWLASGGYGVQGYGVTGGLFASNAGSGIAYVAGTTYGVYATGSSYGGYFYDFDNSGTATLAFGDVGVSGGGTQAGGHFTKPASSAEAYLAASDGGWNNGVYGVASGPLDSPDYFLDAYNGSWARVGWISYKVAGNGAVYFIQNDPTDASRVIEYAAPEGDEVAVYTRGTARLENGIAHVTLGPTFQKVANPEIGLTAMATAIGDPIPLSIASKSTTQLVVRGPAGSSAAFDYAVWGLRIGFEDRPVVNRKTQESFIPSRERDSQTYATIPELKAFNARSRFARMESAVNPERALTASTGAAQALEAAIHVYDRSIDSSKLLGGIAAAPLPRAQPPEIQDRTRGANPRGGAGVDAHASATALGQSAQSPLAFDASHDSQRTRTVGAAAAFPLNTMAVTVAETVEAGDLLSIDAARPGEAIRSSLASDPVVIGIVVGDKGQSWSTTAPLALAGCITFVKADATAASIAAGDLLVSSPLLGHAMRAGENPKQGTVVAKALESIEAGTGMIRVLVMSR